MKIKLSNRFTIEFTIEGDRIECTWYPEMGLLTDAEYAAYLRARDEMLRAYVESMFGLPNARVVHVEQDSLREIVDLEDDRRDLH